MKRFLISIAITLSIPSLLFSQTGFANYDAIVSRSLDGTPKEERHEDDIYAKAILYFDNNVALYQQWLPDSAMTKRSGTSIEGISRMKYPVDPSDKTGAIYKIDYANKKIKARMPIYSLQSFHIVDDAVEPISWSIKAERKKVGRFNAQKAETEYLGRKWTVWFTTDVPVSVGPWKLYGLPGLILEAEDEEQKFKFYLRDLEIPSNAVTASVMNPKELGRKSMSKQEFVEFEKRKKDDQYRFRKAKMEAAAEGGGPVTLKIKFAETIEIYN